MGAKLAEHSKKVVFTSRLWHHSEFKQPALLQLRYNSLLTLRRGLLAQDAAKLLELLFLQLNLSLLKLLFDP